MSQDLSSQSTQEIAMISAQLAEERQRNAMLQTALQSALAEVVKGEQNHAGVVAELNRLKAENEKREKIETAFAFTDLPSELQTIIAQKTDFLSFNSLKQCSKGMQALCQRSTADGFRPEWHVTISDLPDSQDDSGRYPQCHWAHLRNGNWTVKSCRFPNVGQLPNCKMMVDSIHLQDGIERFYTRRNLVLRKLSVLTMDDAEKVSSFLKEHDVRELEVRGYSDSMNEPEAWSAFIRHPAVQKLTSLQVHIAEADHVEDDWSNFTDTRTLLAIRAETLALPRTDSNVLQAYLEAWRSGEKTIVDARFHVVTDLPDDLDAMISKVDTVLLPFEPVLRSVQEDFVQFQIARAHDILVVQFSLVDDWNRSDHKHVSFVACTRTDDYDDDNDDE